jgi:pimeloyl-ACP methyl ester carboxylesterase
MQASATLTTPPCYLECTPGQPQFPYPHQMRLTSRTWGSGHRLAVLLHGMMGSADQFHRVGPALADRGYRAIALDLPGHGTSPAATDADLAMFAASVVESVAAVVESVEVRPELAIGHSLGAVVLAEALPALRPSRAVYVDVPFDGPTPGLPAEMLSSNFGEAKAARTFDRLRQSKPGWSEEDYRVEAEAARQFDVATAVALEVAYSNRPRSAAASTGGSTVAIGASTAPTGASTAALRPTSELPSQLTSTEVPSLLIRAEPSKYVSAERAAELEACGFTVRSIEGAGHSVWYGHFDEFMGALDGWV